MRIMEDTLTSGIAELKRRLAEGEHLVKVGLPDILKETLDGKPVEYDLAAIARVNEFGSETRNIPERPAFRRGLGGGAKDFNRLNAVQLRLIALGRQTVQRALGLLGLMGAAKVKVEIVEGDFVENAPSTIARKGSSHPLIATSQEHNSVTYQVVE